MTRHTANVLFVLLLVAVLALGTIALARGKPKPPPCDCAPTVGPCVLDQCGQFDCTYVCPFP